MFTMDSPALIGGRGLKQGQRGCWAPLANDSPALIGGGGLKHEALEELSRVESDSPALIGGRGLKQCSCLVTHMKTGFARLNWWARIETFS